MSDEAIQSAGEQVNRLFGAEQAATGDQATIERNQVEQEAAQRVATAAFHTHELAVEARQVRAAALSYAMDLARMTGTAPEVDGVIDDAKRILAFLNGDAPKAH